MEGKELYVLDTASLAISNSELLKCQTATFNATDNLTLSVVYPAQTLDGPISDDALKFDITINAADFGRFMDRFKRETKINQDAQEQFAKSLVEGNEKLVKMMEDQHLSEVHRERRKEIRSKYDAAKSQWHAAQRDNDSEAIKATKIVMDAINAELCDHEKAYNEECAKRHPAVVSRDIESIEKANSIMREGSVATSQLLAQMKADVEMQRASLRDFLAPKEV
jgi:hypothetical protein